MINEKEIEAWVLSLKVDKQYGLGVAGIYLDREEQIPQGIVKSTIDDLDELDIILISRALGEAVWEIDYKLYTRESLAKNQGEEFNTQQDVTQYFDIEPYVPQDLEALCMMHPIGQDIKNDEYEALEGAWYKRVSDGFDDPKCNEDIQSAFEEAKRLLEGE